MGWGYAHLFYIMIVKTFKIDKKLIDAELEDLGSIVEAAKANDETQMTQALVESTKSKIIKDHIYFFDASIRNGVYQCVVWDETKHDYALEFCFIL